MSKQPGEDDRICRDESTLGAITARQILRSEDGHRLFVLTLDEQNFRVIVSEISALDNLGDESPKFERLLDDWLRFIGEAGCCGITEHRRLGFFRRSLQSKAASQ